MSTRGLSKSKSKKPLETTLGKAPPCTNPVDVSHVRKPIETSLFGLNQVLNLYETATDEVRRYVTYECEIMYECRICRTIFRSLANFILHKRNYCQESFKTGYSQNFPENPTQIYQDEELERKSNKRQTTPSPPSTDLKQSSNAILELLLENNSGSKENKKCLDSVVCLLKEKQTSALITEQCLNEDISNESSQVSENFDLQSDVALQKIKESSTGVFQTMLQSMTSEFNKVNLMKSEVMEIHSILDNNEAILDRDGKIIENKLHNSFFVCTICNNKFSTKKTLTYHIKFKHNNTRMLYRCPQCKDTFANTWGVFRHLYKIHHKTTAQVKKLRSQIHSNLVRKDELPEEESTCRTRSNSLSFTEQRNLEVENQQWMDNFELDNDVQRCGGCGRKFERKAALHSHSQFCSKRIAVCNSLKEGKKPLTEEKPPDKANGNVTGEIILQGSKRRKPLIAQKLYRVDYVSNKKDDNLTSESSDEIATDENNPHLTIIQKYKELSDPVIEIVDSGDEDFQGFENCNEDEEKHLTANKDILERLENNCDTKASEDSLLNYINDCIEISSDEDKLSQELKEIDELSYLSDSSSINNNKNKRKRENVENEENNKFKIIDIIIDDNEELENDSNLMLETRSTDYVDFDNISCLSCKQSFPNKIGLMNHMGRHFNWHRYQCLDCFYTSYDKIICEEHVRAKHNIEDLETVQTIVQPLPVVKTLELSSNFIHFSNNKPEKTKEEAVELETNKELDSSNTNDIATNTIVKETMTDVKQSENSNSDPLLMNMIMEVIFGGSNGNSNKDTETNTTSSDSIIMSEEPTKILSKLNYNSPKRAKIAKTCIKVKPIEIPKPSKIEEIDKKVSSESSTPPPKVDDFQIIKPLETSKSSINCDIKKSETEDVKVITELQLSDSDSASSPSKSPENTKSIPSFVRDTARPVRNRIIPIQKDFLYDMKTLKQKLSKDGEIINTKESAVVKKQKSIKTYLGKSKQQSKSPDCIDIDLCDSNSNVNIKEDVNRNSKMIDKVHVTAD